MISNLPSGYGTYTETLSFNGEVVVELVLTRDEGRWECRRCDADGAHPDHVVARGEASTHTAVCGSDNLPLWVQKPRHAWRITGPFGAVVTIANGRWECRNCHQTGTTDDMVCLAAIANIHAVLCGAPDSEATAATLVVDNPALRRSMSEWVDERVQGGLADLQEQLQNSEELRKLAEQAIELAHQERKEAYAERDAANARAVAADQRQNTDIAVTLIGDSDRLRAEVTKPDLKASVLVAAAVGAVVAGGGALGATDLPVAAIGTGAGAVAAAVAAVVTLLVAMRPGVSTDPDTLVTSDIRDVEGQVEQARTRTQTPDLDALARERAGLQRLALRKFKLVRWAIDGALGSIGLAGVTAAIGAVSALVGGA